MATYAARRRADITLWYACRRIRKKSRWWSKKRKAASKTMVAFGARIVFRSHKGPSYGSYVMSLGFRYGRYGGVGHGVPVGEWRKPIDDLDRAFLAHDKAYASSEALVAWEAKQPGHAHS